MRTWFATPLQLRTCENFKLHFRDEQNVLESIMDGSIADSNLHQANIVQQVLEGMQTMFLRPDQDPQLDYTQVPPPQPAPAPAPAPANPATPATSIYQANTVQQQDPVTALMPQMAQMQTLIMSLQQQIQNNSNQTQDPPRRRRGQKYCWTHGACNHNSSDCKSKAQNHIDTATFKNRQGGSNKGCK